MPANVRQAVASALPNLRLRFLARGALPGFDRVFAAARCVIGADRGQSYSACFDGASDMSPAEPVDAGLNQGSVHVDFVVGSKELAVFGGHEDGTNTSTTPLNRVIAGL